MNDKKRSKSLVQGPGTRKNLSGIESYTKQFTVMSRTYKNQKCKNVVINNLLVTCFITTSDKET